MVMSFLCGRQHVHRVFPNGTHWVTRVRLLPGYEILIFTEFVLFYSSASASTAGSSVMSFIEVRIFMSSPMDLVSLHVAQICRLPVFLMVRSKAGCFWSILYLICVTGKARDAHFELLPLMTQVSLRSYFPIIS